MKSVIARIILRYASGILVAKGILPDDLGNELAFDPEAINLIETSIGLVIGVGTEWWYKIARKLGWER